MKLEQLYENEKTITKQLEADGRPARRDPCSTPQPYFSRIHTVEDS